MSCSNEVFALRKSHKLAEALAKARECYAAAPNDVWTHRAYGWVLYDLIKHEVDEFEAKRVSPGHLANRFNAMLSEYRQFAEHVRPDLLHSRMLDQVLKGQRAWDGFLDFARWWGAEYLREEDRQPYIPPEGREVPSLAARYLYAIGRDASSRAQEIAPDVLAWAEDALDRALEGSPNDQWLHYYKSKLLLGRGATEQARHCLLPVVRRQQGTAWVWSLLGQTYEREDPANSITCYFQAVSLAREPQEVANTRIALARLLAAQDRFEEATVQVRSALAYRNDNNFRIPQGLAQLANTTWYSQFAGRADLPREPDVTQDADGILLGLDRGQMEYRVGVIDNQNTEKTLAHVAFTPDEGSVLPYRHFKGVDLLSVGAIIEIGWSGLEGRALRWSRTEVKTIEGFVQQMSGTMTQRDGQAFGFMMTSAGERVFVHPGLMAQQPTGQANVKTCDAMMGRDKQGRLGWRALRWVEAAPMP
jgi:tetratricopeptide (TPR) repeat protein